MVTTSIFNPGIFWKENYGDVVLLPIIWIQLTVKATKDTVKLVISLRLPIFWLQGVEFPIRFSCFPDSSWAKLHFPYSTFVIIWLQGLFLKGYRQRAFFLTWFTARRQRIVGEPSPMVLHGVALWLTHLWGPYVLKDAKLCSSDVPCYLAHNPASRSFHEPKCWQDHIFWD